MDILYYMGYYTALFFIPFVVYFLVFKKNNGRSVYTDRDWFYLVKFYYAKKAVKSYQERYNKYKRNVEKEDEIPTHSNSQFIYGVDQEGNSFSLKFTLLHGRTAEVDLCLRLSNGNEYIFPGEHHLFQCKIAKQQWKINGLNIEVLEPYRRFRVVFNGLLQNAAVKDYEKVEHVQLNLIFNASGSPVYIPNGMDTSLLADALARETWRDGSWIDYLVDQSGYEQFGALQGFIKGDSYPNEHVLNLATVRSKLRGIDDRFLLNRALKIFIVDTYGILINIVIKSFEHKCSQVNYGSAILSNNVVLPIKGLDIVLKNVGKNKILPDMIAAHIEVKSKLFVCILHLNMSKMKLSRNTEENGYECYNIPAECDVNNHQGHALVEFWYSEKGHDKFKYEYLLCEKPVSIPPNVLVSNIKSEESQILKLTGGKGNSLALLAALDSKDYIVPDGFIVTVNAFKLQLKSSLTLLKILKQLNNVSCGKKSGKIEDVCNECVEHFKREKIIPEIANAVIRELSSIKKGSNGEDVIAWAVRSSAVGEDSEELSAAGQNETFLGCLTVEQVLKSISACWASLFAFQSVQYRRQHGLPVLSHMAVVVQKMVPSDSAGVLFTWHPSTSNPSQMVITSNFGLGESVVSGKSDPDTFILNRTWDNKVCLINRSIGVKDKIIRMTDEGVAEYSSESEFKIPGWSITQEQALYLGKVGVVLEKAFGGPRDIEWAFYKDELYLLQCRPITTLNSWSEYELTHELDYPIISDKLVFTVANIAEVIPNSLTVLSQTSSASIVDRVMQIHAQGYLDPFVRKAVCTFQHRGMLEVINSLHKNVQKDIKIASTILDLAVFGHPVLDEKIHYMAVNRLGISSSQDQLREVLRIMKLAITNPKMLEKIKQDAANFIIDLKEDDSLLEMHNKIGESFEELNRFALYHTYTSSVCVFFQIIALVVLSKGNKELTTDHYLDYSLILSSCEDVISAEIPMYLEKIAAIIRNEGYNEEFCTIKPEFGVTWLKTKCPEAYAVFEKFLETHGHRSLGEFEMIEESWGENPSLVIPMIQANAKYVRNVEKKNLSLDEMVQHLVSPKNSITRSIIKFISKKIRSAVGLRELSKSEMVRTFNKLKLAYKHLAEQMVLQGVLPSANLIYHLTHYEIGQVIQKENPTLISKAVKRQRLYPKWCKLKFPEIMFGIPVPEKEEELHVDSAEKLCKGMPVCTGTVKARACVIKSLDEIDQLQLGDVLITYSTDISWSPYFPMLSGIVTELGGLISHGAVVAREYGLPCIIGVKDATKVFKTGDIVILSGNTGEIGQVKENE